MEINIQLNPQTERFETTVEGISAFLTYSLEEGVLTLLHTEVPPALGGKGIGSRLAGSALDYARQEHLKVVAKCSFVAKYIERHQEYADLLA